MIWLNVLKLLMALLYKYDYFRFLTLENNPQMKNTKREKKPVGMFMGSLWSQVNGSSIKYMQETWL